MSAFCKNIKLKEDRPCFFPLNNLEKKNQHLAVVEKPGNNLSHISLLWGNIWWDVGRLSQKHEYVWNDKHLLSADRATGVFYLAQMIKQLAWIRDSEHEGLHAAFCQHNKLTDALITLGLVSDSVSRAKSLCPLCALWCYDGNVLMTVSPQCVFLRQTQISFADYCTSAHSVIRQSL